MCVCMCACMTEVMALDISHDFMKRMCFVYIIMFLVFSKKKKQKKKTKNICCGYLLEAPPCEALLMSTSNIGFLLFSLGSFLC